MISNKRIFKNTIALYVRQILMILITLYSMRVVLNELGLDDFGVFSVITGFVTLLVFLPGSMASATQRFFSFAMGEKNISKLKQTFGVNIIMYAVIATIAYVLLQTIGLWYVEEYLKLPDERSGVALKLYQYTSLSFVFSILTAPFIAILIAHEDMHIYAVISVFDAVLKLVAAISLAYVSHDLLLFYGIALLVISVMVAFIYVVLCVVKYAECKFKNLQWNSVMFREIVSFTGWTLFGQLSTAFRNQAVTILVNQMFNPVVVAARVIALNVATQVAIFSTNLNTGLYPSIIKTYAANEKEHMTSLVFNGSKFTFFLMWIMSLPILLEMETILKLWLKNPPIEATLFTQLAIVESLIFALSMPLTTAARAPGKMALYEIILGSIQIAIFFVSWWVLTLGYSAEWVFYVAIMANVLMFKVRLFLVDYLIGFPIVRYYQKVVWPVFAVLIVSVIPSVLVLNILPNNIYASVMNVLLSGCISLLAIYYLGLDKVWRKRIVDLIQKKIFKSRNLV